MNDRYLLQLNIVYGQYIIDAQNQYLVSIDIREILSTISNHNNDSYSPYLMPLVHQYYECIWGLYINSAEAQHLNSNYFRYSNALINNQRVQIVDYQISNENNNQVMCFLDREFAAELNNQLISALSGLRLVDSISIECFNIAYKKYLQDINNNGTNIANIEYINSIYINYFSTIYNTFLNYIQYLHIQAIQEPLSSLNNLYQGIIYRIYLQNINNIFNNQYLDQPINLIYSQFMNIFSNHNIHYNFEVSLNKSDN